MRALLLCLLALPAFAQVVVTLNGAPVPTAATPTCSPVAGTYPVSQTVTLSDSTPSSSMFYTVDGSAPTFPLSGSTAAYSSPFLVPVPTLLRSIATASGYLTSAIGSCQYNLTPQAPAPTFSPTGGSYTGSQTVTIADAAGFPSIYYTTDGSVPTTGSTAYSTPITVASSSTVKAIATAAGYTQSPVGSASYTINGVVGSCPVTFGSGQLVATSPRQQGVSPLLVFFDATATTGGAVNANMTQFQDVTFTWNFGDSGSSGTGTWAYGSRPGFNSMNTATGAIAAHLYRPIEGSGNQPYTATVTAVDKAGTTASCTVAVTAYDPQGVDGFPGTATTCVNNSTQGSGCPAGAKIVNASSISTVLSNPAYFASGKRVLFKCGDTFSSGLKIPVAKTWSIGAYGTCVDNPDHTQMPHFQNTTFGGSVVASTITIPLTAGDGRIADIDFESSNNFADGAFATDYNPGVIPYQITMYNLYSSGPKGCFTWQAGAQFGLIQAYCTVPSVAGYIATFLNVTENIPGGYTGNLFNNLNYQAIIGSYFQGGGLVPHGLGVETIRISAGQDIVVSNNTIRDADTQGAVLKIHNGTKGSVSTWSGTYTQNVMVTDNLFSGTSGGNLVETAPQNSGDDERLRYIVLERNYFNAPTSAYGGTQFLLSAQNTTVRDNVFNMTGAAIKQYPAYGVLAGQRGSLAPITQYVEVYNNSFYGSADTFGSQTNIAFAVAGDLVSAASNSVAENNLAYMLTTGGGSTVQNTGTGNTVSNNTATRTNNPAFTNGTGLYSIMSDFKPTAQYTGALNGVPVIYDALGVAWSPTWDLGAVHH